MKLTFNEFHWLPRIICILAICFASLFAMDAFTPGLTIWQQLGGFFIHLIPSFILIIFLSIAWKWEFLGGIIYMIIGLVTSPLLFLFNRNVNHFTIGQCIGIVLLITFPFLVVGVLFVLSHLMKKKQLKKTHSL